MHVSFLLSNCKQSITSLSLLAGRIVNSTLMYNPFVVYCRELAPGIVSLTGDRAQDDDSKHDLYFMFMYSPYLCIF